jgi:hypothetical protein
MLSIGTPTSAATYAAAATPLALAGTASDDVAVTQVSWTNSAGGSGIATGTTAWSASGIALRPGTNTLTVTARDAAGNTAVRTLTVTYTPSFILTVARAGSGSGTVTSSPTGIDCGSACAWSYASGPVMTLTATPAAGSIFTGWTGGGCSAQAPAW